MSSALCRLLLIASVSTLPFKTSRLFVQKRTVRIPWVLLWLQIELELFCGRTSKRVAENPRRKRRVRQPNRCSSSTIDLVSKSIYLLIYLFITAHYCALQKYLHQHFDSVELISFSFLETSERNIISITLIVILMTSFPVTKYCWKAS